MNAATRTDDRPITVGDLMAAEPIVVRAAACDDDACYCCYSDSSPVLQQHGSLQALQAQGGSWTAASTITARQ